MRILLRKTSTNVGQISLVGWQHYFCKKIRHGGHHKTMMLYQNSWLSMCMFTWRTILPNLIPIWFETSEPWALLFSPQQEEKEKQQKQQEQEDEKW